MKYDSIKTLEKSTYGNTYIWCNISTHYRWFTWLNNDEIIFKIWIQAIFIWCPRNQMFTPITKIPKLCFLYSIFNWLSTNNTSNLPLLHNLMSKLQHHRFYYCNPKYQLIRKILQQNEVQIQTRRPMNFKNKFNWTSTEQVTYIDFSVTSFPADILIIFWTIKNIIIYFIRYSEFNKFIACIL